jgi:hypothetical protein
MICFSFITLLGGIITVYVKTQVDIAKINVSITFFQKDLDRKELAILTLEKSNKLEHDNIIKKIDTIIERDYIKK